MKKIVTYIIVILVCIVFCFIFSNIGVRFEGSRHVNPWAFTIGVLVIAVIMAIVHKIESKRHLQKPKDNTQDK